MPYNKMIQKAGKWSFLLVCLFLCSACGREKAVFRAADFEGQEDVFEEKEQDDVSQKPAPEPEKKADEEKCSLVNINTADEAELMTLPGIGKVRAEAIVLERENQGTFEKIEDIMRVKGIKQGIFNKISSFICVE